MATASKGYILKLYKTLLRESQKFDSYNYRYYALRRIRDAFRSNKALSDTGAITKCISDAEKNLEIIKRQVIIGKMYASDKLVIENYLTAKEVSPENLQ